MILYRTADGFVLEDNGKCYSLVARDMDEIICHPDIYDYLESVTAGGAVTSPPSKDELLAPIGRQEVWAAGVTYFRSRTARMQESEEAGVGASIRPPFINNIKTKHPPVRIGSLKSAHPRPAATIPLRQPGHGLLWLR